MLWRMMEEKSKFNKEEIKEIGEKFTALRREFVPFAIQYHNAKLKKIVDEQFALAEARNPGSTVKLRKAVQAADQEDTASRPAAGAVTPTAGWPCATRSRPRRAH
jgi:hypothetical protein